MSHDLNYGDPVAQLLAVIEGLSIADVSCNRIRFEDEVDDNAYYIQIVEKVTYACQRPRGQKSSLRGLLGGDGSAKPTWMDDNFDWTAA